MRPNMPVLINPDERPRLLATGVGSSVVWLLAIAGALVVSLAVAAAGRAQEVSAAAWQVAWQQQLPFLSAQPQIVGDTVRVFAGNDVLSLDLATGGSRWRIQPPPAQGLALRLGCCQTGAAPTDSGLYTLAGGNEIWALDPATGAVRWHRPLGDAVQAPPTVAGSTVAVVTREGVESVVYGLDATSGGRLWQVHPGQALPRLVAAGDTVFVPLASGSTVAYAAADGRQLWSTPADARSALISPQQISGDLIVLPTEAGVVALDRGTGDQRWTAQLPALPIDARVVEGSVYSRTIDGTIVALDRGDGHEWWRADVGALHIQALSAAVAGRLFAVGQEGIVALDASTGSQLWQRSSDVVLAAPLATDDLVYVGTFDGDLLVLDAATGAESGRLPLGGSIFESPTLSPNGLLLVASNRQIGSGLFAIRRGGTNQ